MMQQIIDYVINNELWLSILISIVSVIITAVLTFLIIRQTGKLNKQQASLQKSINQQQMELQARQIKIELFPLKRELYLNIRKVFVFVSELINIIDKVDLQSKTCAQLRDIFQICDDTHLVNSHDLAINLHEADYLLPEYISAYVKDISRDFDLLRDEYAYFRLADIVCTPEEQENIKKEKIPAIKLYCNNLVKHIPFIFDVMPKDMKIGDLDRV